MKLSLSRSAQRDLEEVISFTAKTWGEKQVQTYIGEIEARFHELLANPEIGRSRSDLRDGCRSLLAEHHVIFYKVIDDTVVVLRILHQSMDVVAAFATDNGDSL